MESRDNIIVTLEDLLNKATEQRKNFIKKLESDEKTERIETVDSIINNIKANKVQTEIKKEQFISEIKLGLGKEIVKNPNSIIIHKKPWYVKMGDSIKRIFMKF